MKRIVPSLWTFVFGIFWTFYCAQAVTLLHGSTSAASQISVDTGVRNTEFHQIPQAHAPYDPFFHAESANGILPWGEIAGTTNEEETEQETKSALAFNHRLHRFLTTTSTGQVCPSHRKRCEPGIPRYLLLGNLRIHDCIEGLIS
jgi:hypothetical protein